MEIHQTLSAVTTNKNEKKRSGDKTSWQKGLVYTYVRIYNLWVSFLSLTRPEIPGDLIGYKAFDLSVSNFVSYP